MTFVVRGIHRVEGTKLGSRDVVIGIGHLFDVSPWYRLGLGRIPGISENGPEFDVSGWYRLGLRQSTSSSSKHRQKATRIISKTIGNITMIDLPAVTELRTQQQVASDAGLDHKKLQRISRKSLQYKVKPKLAGCSNQVSLPKQSSQLRDPEHAGRHVCD
jgi:hypothetical protein